MKLSRGRYNLSYRDRMILRKTIERSVVRALERRMGLRVTPEGLQLTGPLQITGPITLGGSPGPDDEDDFGDELESEWDLGGDLGAPERDMDELDEEVDSSEFCEICDVEAPPEEVAGDGDSGDGHEVCDLAETTVL